MGARTHTLPVMNDLASSICNFCYTFADDVKVTGVDLGEDVKTLKAVPPRWNLSRKLDKCQRLTRGGWHRGKEMGDNLDGSQIKDPAVNMASDFKPLGQCVGVENKARDGAF